MRIHSRLLGIVAVISSCGLPAARAAGDVRKGSWKFTGRRYGFLVPGALAVSAALAWPGAAAVAQNAEQKNNLATRPEFREPVVLTSKEGVLEVRLTARQGRLPSIQ